MPTAPYDSAIPMSRLFTVKNTHILLGFSWVLEMIRSIAGFAGHGGSTISSTLSSDIGIFPFTLLSVAALLVLTALYGTVFFLIAGGRPLGRIVGTACSVFSIGGLFAVTPGMIVAGAFVGLIVGVALGVVNILWIIAVWQQPIARELESRRDRS